MNTTIARVWVWVFFSAFVGAWPFATAFAHSPRSSFALLDEPGGDTSVHCRATFGPFTMHITMTNRGDAGGEAGFIRVTYRDLDGVSYAIPTNTTVQISLVGGSIPGVDDTIKVSGDGAGGSVLVGQASMLADLGVAFCCTSPACEVPF
jgi:hypothetical protein